MMRRVNSNAAASCVRLLPHTQSYPPTDGCEGVIGGRKHPSVLDCGLTPHVVFNPSVVHIHQSHPLLSSDGLLNNYQHVLAAAETVELEFMITCRKDSLGKGIFGAHSATTLDTFAKVVNNTNSKRARGGVPYHGVLTLSRPLLCPHVPSQNTPTLLSPPGTLQLTIDRAQENIDALQKTVDTAFGHVWELELVVDCLKMSVAKDRNLTEDEYTALEKGAHARINLGYVRATTALGTFTKEEAEAKIKEAEAKIEKAKLEIEKAKLEIKEAKLEIKDAEAKIEKAKIYYTPESLVLDANNSEFFCSFQYKGTALGGRASLLTKMRRIFDTRGMPKIAQTAFTFTLAGTNGVGKTHCSLLIGSREFNQDPEWSMVSAYCGVNNGWPLSDVEKEYVTKKLPLKDVIHTRVALALHHRANNMDSHWASLAIKNTKVLPHAQAFDIIMTAVQKIKKSKPHASHHVVFGVFDEIQVLEREFDNVVVDPSRVILRILRELQVEVANSTGVLFVGFGTGTLFRSKESDATAGTNIVINEPFCERVTFESLIEADTPLQKKIIARMIYPRARLIGSPRDGWARLLANFTADEAKRMLPHALAKHYLPLHEFGGCIPFVGQQSSDQDVEKFLPLDDYILMVSCVRMLTSFPCNPNHLVTNCSTFESWVGDALCAVLALATSADAGSEVRSVILKQNPWVSTVFGTADPVILDNVRIVNLDNSKSNILPFTGAVSLGNAIDRGVRPDIEGIVKGMKKGHLIMFRCEGSAPFDYVMFAKLDDKTKVRVALFDSKHTETGGLDTAAKAMASKFKMVAEKLKETFELTMAPPFIVTNRGVPKDTEGVEYITGDNLCLGGLTRAAFESMDDKV